MTFSNSIIVSNFNKNNNNHKDGSDDLSGEIIEEITNYDDEMIDIDRHSIDINEFVDSWLSNESDLEPIDVEC